MQDRIVRGVFNISANKESSPDGLYFLDPGTRNIKLGRLTSEAVHGIRRKGALLSSGAIIVESAGTTALCNGDGLCDHTKGNGERNVKRKVFGRGRVHMLKSRYF